MGLSSEALYQYVPATKIKGLDDWVPESFHYSFYSKSMFFLHLTVFDSCNFYDFVLKYKDNYHINDMYLFCDWE